MAVVVINLGSTLAHSHPKPLRARHAATGLGLLDVAAPLGLVLALPAVLPFALVASVIGHGLPRHLVAGSAGRFTLTAMGVGLKLLSMFTLAPEKRG